MERAGESECRIAELRPDEKGLESDKELSADSATSFHTAEGGEGKPELRSSSPGPDSAGIDVRNTNLDYYHAEARFDQRLATGHFTKIKSMSDCCRGDGKVELHRWRNPSLENASVVVKRVLTSRVSANAGKESNERKTYLGHCQRHAEDVLNEIGIYCYLARQHDLPKYILRMHAVFQAGTDVWLVLEHANEGDLFTVVQKMKRENKGTMPLNQVMLWTWQLLQAIRYLHGHGIGHRDISIENVLLCDGLVRLMDFGQSVRTHASNGELLRYFCALGKPYYRPPECYVPGSKAVQVMVPRGARPGEICFAQTSTKEMCDVRLPSSASPGQVCIAEPWGYTVPPIDVFAAGVCLFIMATGMPPWRKANLSDAHFYWVHAQGVAKLIQSWKKPLPAELVELVSCMMNSDPSHRPPLEACLAHTWFKGLRGMAVPIHHVAEVAEVAAPIPTSSMGALPSMAAGFDYRDDALADFAHEAVGCVSALESLAETGAAGDPYSMPMAVRSVHAVAEVPFHPAGFAGDFYMPDDVHGFASPPEEIPLERASCFSAEYTPPSVPADKAFEFELTTLFMTSSVPEELGNELLSFLKQADGVTVQKVDQRKFTVTAQSDSDAGDCTLKVRLYSQGGNRYAAEFQRRSGDSMALNDVYQKALDHFKEQLVAVEQDAAPPAPEATPKASPQPESPAAELSAVAMPASEKSEQTAKLHASELALLTANFTSQLPVTRPAFSKAEATKGLAPLQLSNRRRRSVPALTNKQSESLLPLDAPPAATSMDDVATIVAGSGLNAVRWRSKSNAGGRRLSNNRLVASGARAISTA